LKSESEDRDKNEKLKACLRGKVSQRAAWLLFTIIGLPLIITGIKVWSTQASDYLRYAEKTELVRCEKRVAVVEVITQNMSEDIKENKKETKIE
jgi:hypothetical protein